MSSESTRGSEDKSQHETESFATISPPQLEPGPITDSKPALTVVHDSVKLQVGERHFETTTETLMESDYFKALLSDDWRHDARPDGSFYIDKDGGLFEHILRYMRSLVLPVFYDKVKGHDEVLYTSLLGEAKFYQIGRLEKWIKERGYLKAVKVTISTEIRDTDYADHLMGGRLIPTSLGVSECESNAEVRHYSQWTGRKIYVCPRRILVHMGDSSRCGRQCNNAKEGGNEFEELPVFRIAEVKRKIVIDQELCLGGWGA